MLRGEGKEDNRDLANEKNGSRTARGIHHLNYYLVVSFVWH